VLFNNGGRGYTLASLDADMHRKNKTRTKEGT
jgi:hypothetical protein